MPPVGNYARNIPHKKFEATMEQIIQGKVVKGLGGLYEVLTDSPTTPRFSCRARGVFRHAEEKVTIGDVVEIRYDDTDPENTAVIHAILPRRNCLIRPPVSNLDYLFCVIAAAKPAPVLETLDKLLAIAEHNEIEPIVIVTKADFGEEESRFYTDLYRRAGITAFCVSGAEGTGVDQLRAYLDEHLRDGRSAAFAGASGVGKSTLLNALFPSLNLATNTISARIQRGRHTTRHVELFPVGNGGFLADTPGFSMLDFMHFDFFGLDDLFYAFREFVPYFGKCRFPDCTHTGEGAEECAIAHAVLEGTIAPSRHESYKKLWAVLKQKERTYR